MMICATLLLFVFVTQIYCYNAEVNVKQGTLVGIAAETLFDKKRYYAFYGVPYAEPPTGTWRFKNPRSAKKWKRPFDARTEYHGACAQAHVVHKHAIYGVEDCLYLNIYTPSLPTDRQNSSKSVVVWVHGYAFTSSFSHVHGGDFFVENDVIFVSVTHRIGVFGFLKLNETDAHANMGLKDIVMALKWIRQNIKQFDGDKNKITVMGSDSAATFLSLLMLTKSSKHFSKMILHSGGLFSPSIFQSNPSEDKIKLESEVYKLTSKKIMHASTQNIITASMKIYNKKYWINAQKPIIPFSPVMERKSNKSLIYSDPYKVLKNFKQKMPIIIGFNSQESISEIIPFLRNPHFLKVFNSDFKFMVPFTDSCSYLHDSKKYTKIGNKIKKIYFKDRITEHSIQDFIRYVSDLNTYPTYKFIREFLNNEESKVYVYKFDFVGKFNVMKATSTPDINIQVKGAAKGDEMCYLMKCEPMWETYVKISEDIQDRDRKFMKEFVELWANFVKSGIPATQAYPGNITWLPMTSQNDNILLINSRSKMIDSEKEQNMFSFWNKLYKEYYSPEHCSGKKHTEL